MLRSIQKLIGDKRKQLIFPVFLMSLDAIGSLVMYLMLYFTVIHLLNGSLTGGLVRNYTIVCLISIILRLIIYRSGYFLCFSRGAEMCSGLRLDLANHYRSLSLGYFNQNSSGYLLSTLTKDLSNFELVLTHTLPSIVKTLVMGCLILVGTFFINWKLALAECVVILIALPVLNWGNRLVEKYGTIKRDLTSKMISIVLEYIKGMKVFKSANMTSTHFTRMSDTLEDIRKTSVQAEVKTAAPTSMYSIIANFLLPFVLLIGSYLFLGGTIASELLVAFMLMSLALSALLIAFEHKPHWKSLFGSVFSKMGNVLSRALRIIICISVIFWLLSYSADGNVANSIIYKVGTFIEPVTSLFGLPWQLFIAFVASAMGKEASLGVMASLFNTGSIWAAIEQSATVDTAALSTSMLSVISRPEALAFLFAFFFNMPCLMALTATTQETHSMKWTVRIALYYVLTALIMATIAYHVGLVIF